MSLPHLDSISPFLLLLSYSLPGIIRIFIHLATHLTLPPFLMNPYYQQSQSPQASRAAAVHNISTAGKSFPAVTPFQRKDSGPLQMKTYQLQTSEVMQFGKDGTTGPKRETRKKKGKEKEEDPSDDGRAPRTPAEVLMILFKIKEGEAKDLIEKTNQFNMLREKNEDALAYIVSRQASRKREEEGVTITTLQLARESLEKYNVLKGKFNLDDDLSFFATYNSSETSGLNIDEINDLDQKYNDDTGEFEEDPDFKETFVSTLEREQEAFYANLPSGGSSNSSGDWALGTVRKEAKNLAIESPDRTKFPGGRYTIHHKVARSGLKKLHQGMELHPRVSQSFKTKLEEIGTRDLNGATNTEKILLNLPFNLEVGPPADKRIGDPGSGVDLNKTRSGTVTPRSNILKEIDGSHTQTGQMDQQTFWEALTGKLQALRDLQDEQLTADGRRGSVLSAPKLEQWIPKDGKFERRAAR